jgi:hypothetical protein
MRHMIWPASCLSALRPGWDYRPSLDEIAEFGFNAVRTFAGRLVWCGQEPHHAIERLPKFLEESHTRGLNCIIPALTDTLNTERGGEAFDRRAHAQAISEIVTPFDILEWGNEPSDRKSQFELTSSFLASLPRPAGVLVMMGAADNDQDNGNYADGNLVTRHLDRGRDIWNMIRRVNELRDSSSIIGKHVMSGEQIGADETDQPGRRCANPSVFYTSAALGQLFGVSTCFHSQDGLWAQPLGPNQRACAEAFMRGVRIIPKDRYEYKNAGHSNSPVSGIVFNDGHMDQAGCTRAYSGIIGNSGFTVELGCVGPSLINWGWSGHTLIDELPNVRVYAVNR